MARCLFWLPLLLAGCERAPVPAPAATVRLMLLAPLPSFRPAASSELQQRWFTMLSYEGLTAATPDGRIVPALAVRYTSPDQRRWRFTLRRGVRFHDGTPVAARHVVDAWSAALHPDSSGGASAALLDLIDGADAYHRGESSAVRGLRSVDDTTLDVTLRRPYGAFPAVLSANALVVTGPGSTDTHVNGTGPWRLVSGAPGAVRYTFARHTGYWSAPARFDSLVALVVRTEEQVTQLLDSGRIDCMHGSEGMLPFALRTDLTVRESPPHLSVMLMLNHRHPLLRQEAFRRAMSLALDRRLLARALSHDDPLMRTSMLPPGMIPWDTAMQPLRPDPDAARAIVARLSPRQIAPLRIAWYEPDTTLPVLLTFRKELEAVGIPTVITRVRGNSAEEFLRDQVDLQLWRWAPPYPEADAMLHGMFDSRSTGPLGNVYGYADAEVDSLFDHERGMAMGPRRDSAVVALGRRLFEKQPAIVLWYGTMSTASSRRVTTCPNGLYSDAFTAIAPVQP